MHLAAERLAIRNERVNAYAAFEVDKMCLHRTNAHMSEVTVWQLHIHIADILSLCHLLVGLCIGREQMKGADSLLVL